MERKAAESPLPDTLHFCLPEERSREARSDKEKSYFSCENQPKFAKWQRIGCLFVENTQSLFRKR